MSRRASVTPRWQEIIRQLIARNPKASAVRLRILLEEELRRTPVEETVLPSLRTVARIKEEFKQVSVGERESYGDFLWPESMERGLLPWEASRRALDLLAYLGDVRPSVRLVKWFWHLTLAAPGASIEGRYELALSFDARSGNSITQVHDWKSEWDLAHKVRSCAEVLDSSA